jgi:hypothetical protein
MPHADDEEDLKVYNQQLSANLITLFRFITPKLEPIYPPLAVVHFIRHANITECQHNIVGA